MDIENELHLIRSEWRIVRSKRLKRKDELLDQGYSIQDIRKDRLFRELKKEQKRLSTRIKHIEKSLNKRRGINVNCDD